jgi:AbrB family looped-hinge helix DNA binding protein
MWIESRAPAMHTVFMAHQTDQQVPRGEVAATQDGRVTIPAQVRRAAGIEPGATLVVYVEDGRVVIETRDQLAARIKRDVTSAWTGPGSVVDELISERRAEAAEHDSR